MSYDIEVSEKFSFQDKGNTVEVMISNMSAVGQIRLFQAINLQIKLREKISAANEKCDLSNESLDEMAGLIDLYEKQTLNASTALAKEIEGMTCNGGPAGMKGKSWEDMTFQEKVELLTKRSDLVFTAARSYLKEKDDTSTSEQALEK